MYRKHAIQIVCSIFFSLSMMGASVAASLPNPSRTPPPPIVAQQEACVTVAQDLKDADEAGDELIAGFKDVTVPDGRKFELILAYRVTQSPVPLIAVVGFIDGCEAAGQHFPPDAYEEFVKLLRNGDPA